ncbi:MAG: methyltransferase domain-containing protein [Parvularculaceae bacterium]
MTSVNSRSLIIAAAIGFIAIAGCGRGAPKTREAEPVPPPPYGEEAANPEVFLDTMEVSSRELYAAREAVLSAAQISPGEKVVDIGAGTGLYTLLFAQAAGPDGVVYAEDIEPRFLKLINQRASDLDLDNVVAVLGRENNITLPENSVDAAFIADTYFYFGDRQAIMASVLHALKPGGRLIIVDYNLNPDAPDAAKHEQVTFGRAGLIDEIKSFGFEYEESPAIAGLNEYYMAVFKKPAA